MSTHKKPEARPGALPAGAAATPDNRVRAGRAWRIAVLVLLAATVIVVFAVRPGRDAGPVAAAPAPAPMLGVTFRVSGTHALYGIALIAAYGVGHCSIIVFAGASTSWVGRYLQWTSASRGAAYLRYASGLLVLAGGAYLIYTA